MSSLLHLQYSYSVFQFSLRDKKLPFRSSSDSEKSPKKLEKLSSILAPVYLRCWRALNCFPGLSIRGSVTTRGKDVAESVAARSSRGVKRSASLFMRRRVSSFKRKPRRYDAGNERGLEVPAMVHGRTASPVPHWLPRRASWSKYSISLSPQAPLSYHI